MKIAIIYICTGKYDIFWNTFYETAEKFFYPAHEKDYFIFTDSKKLLTLKDSRIHAYYQTKSGWPYDTLLRFNWICTVQDRLNDYDYCYYVNANSKLLKTLDENVVPFPTKDQGMVLWVHTKSYEDYTGETFHPERNPISTACIPEGTPCRAYGGGFWGGTSEAVIKMSRELRDRTAIDLSNDFIAIWHDQSHVEKYGVEISPLIIRDGIIASEENANWETCCLIFQNKKHFGGNDALRELSFKEKVANTPKKMYVALLKVANIIGIERYVHIVVDAIRGKK